MFFGEFFLGSRKVEDYLWFGYDKMRCLDACQIQWIPQSVDSNLACQISTWVGSFKILSTEILSTQETLLKPVLLHELLFPLQDSLKDHTDSQDWFGVCFSVLEIWNVDSLHDVFRFIHCTLGGWYRGRYITPFMGIKQYKSVVIFRNFPFLYCIFWVGIRMTPCVNRW